jgi:NADPH:quinone reductase-like Zn-dependent oxidoreductase
MKAARIHKFGSPDVIVVEEVPCPAPAAGEILVRVTAAGVGPWDAIIREGQSKVSPPPPLTLGSDLAGVVEAVGPGVAPFKEGDSVYGVTNPQFCGANAEYAICFAKMISPKPRRLSEIEAASVPVVAVTALQMLFDYAHAVAGQAVMILGAAGNVGAYAVQLAARAGLHVVGVAGARNGEFVRSLGAHSVVDDPLGTSEDNLPAFDVVIDTVGGEMRERSIALLKPAGILVSVVSTGSLPTRSDVRTVFFYVEVTSERLATISELFDHGKLLPHVGNVLPLQQVRAAHRMLAGAPHKPGKIVLEVAI